MPIRSTSSGLLRVLGRVFALAVAVGTTIGGGILYAPGKVAAQLPNPWLYMGIWVLGGINALLGATVYAELGAMIPLSAGPYPYARRALGEYAGFVVGYSQWLLDCASDAVLLLLVGEYAYALLPALEGHAVAVALATLGLLTAINWRSVQDGGRFQVAATVAKTVALGGLLLAAFLLPHAPVAAGQTLAVPQGLALATAVMVAMPGVIFTYDSYYVPIFFGEELRDPGREIPRAIFRGLAVTIAMYLLLNAAILWVLPMERIADSPFAGGAVAEALFGTGGDRIIRVIVMISMLGTINAGVLITARALHAMGRDGLFLRSVTRVNAGGTPTVALLLSSLAAAAFVISGTLDSVLGVVAILLAVSYLAMFVSLIVLRRREPQLPRPYRAWGYPWSTGAAILIGLIVLAGLAATNRRDALVTLGLLLVSYPVHRVTRRLLRRAA